MADVKKDAAAWLRDLVEDSVIPSHAVLLWVLDEAERVDAEPADDAYDLGYLAALETTITKMALALGWTP